MIFQLGSRFRVLNNTNSVREEMEESRTFLLW